MSAKTQRKVLEKVQEQEIARLNDALAASNKAAEGLRDQMEALRFTITELSARLKVYKDREDTEKLKRRAPRIW